MTNIQTLSIDEIRIDCDTQARVAISESAVADYAEALNAGETLPPVVVFTDGEATYLGDGFHRLHANLRIGARTIACEVRTGTLADAQLFAYTANRAHGLRLTNEDKRKAVAGMLALMPGWSDRAIARHVGVGNNLVSEMRNPAVAAARAAAKAALQVAAPASGAGDRLLSDNSAGTLSSNSSQTRPSAPASAMAPTAAPPSGSAEPDDDGPSAEEVATAEAAEQGEREALQLLMAADDKLAAAHAKILQQAERIRLLEARVLGLTNEAAQAIRLAKSWRSKCEQGAGT